MTARDRLVAWMAAFPSGPADTLLLIAGACYGAVLLADLACTIAAVLR
jgi:hypothetical protein